MTFSYEGTPPECMANFEQFLEELMPEKPKRNHGVMIAEHLVLGLQKDKTSVHKLEADVDIEAGTLTFSFKKNEA